MKLVLIRHGESNWNKIGIVQGWRDPHLSKRGQEQVKSVASKLSSNHFDALYSTSLCRAYESARIISDQIGLPIITKEGLKEMHFGQWEGKSLKKVEEEYPGMLARWFENPTEMKIPGGESITSFKARVVSAFDEIRSEHINEDVLAVLHGGVISIYLVHLLGMKLDRIWRIPLKNTAITTLVFDGDRVNLANFNDTCHLSEELTFQRAW